MFQVCLINCLWNLSVNQRAGVRFWGMDVPRLWGDFQIQALPLRYCQRTCSQNNAHTSSLKKDYLLMKTSKTIKNAWSAKHFDTFLFSLEKKDVLLQETEGKPQILSSHIRIKAIKKHGDFFFCTFSGVSWGSWSDCHKIGRQMNISAVLSVES